MARNIEIKARISDLDPIRARAASLVTSPMEVPLEVIDQIDTFFDVPHGRLKVRQFADGSGELISYHRADDHGPKQSEYTRVGCEDARSLIDALARALPLRGTVSKRRELFLIGRTRLHLDRVEQLGSFVELEVVLADGESTDHGTVEARELLLALQIPQTALVAEAYIDLLESNGVTRDSSHQAR